MSDTLRILVVEDHQDTLMVLHRLLQRDGHDVVTAATFAEAISACEAGRFDVLLADIGLPDGSGLNLARPFKQRGPGVAVALTGFGTDNDLEKVKLAGFDHSLVKPLTFTHLITLLQQIAANRQATSRPDAPPPTSDRI